ncbi:MAG: ubiquinone/menaquinone biosynthesis methyltransferase [Candidatus Omnitrophica bacterium]|nr:ubiquinone/menaquinone biosynthesis methyltransferase [Candidatus Omnitrophota bacterium]
MKDPYAAPSGTFIRRAFDSISFRYDLLNRILSFNAVADWRRRTRELLAEKGFPEAGSMLDVGVGTGEFLREFSGSSAWSLSVGLDFSPAMMRLARQKAHSGTEFVNADFHSLPFRDAGFDRVISAFTLRSVQDMTQFLREISRVLKPGGVAVFLDLTRPRNLWHKLFFYPYVKFGLPLAGGLISGNFSAYRFLAHSVEHFQGPEEVVIQMETAGFVDCSTKSFSFGAVTLIIGRKNKKEPVRESSSHELP